MLLSGGLGEIVLDELRETWCRQALSHWGLFWCSLGMWWGGERSGGKPTPDLEWEEKRRPIR